MNKKLFSQVWNERGHNVSLFIELLLVSVVMWYVVDMLYVRLSVYLEPLGFNTEHCYLLGMSSLDKKSPEYIASRDTSTAIATDIAELMVRLSHRPEIEAVSLSRNSYPYNGSNSGIFVKLDTMRFATDNKMLIARCVSPDFFRVFRYCGAKGESSETLAKRLNSDRVFMASDNCFNAYGRKMTDYIGRRFEWGGDSTMLRTMVASLQPVRYSDYQEGGTSFSVVSLFPQEYYDTNKELCVRVHENMDNNFIGNLKHDSERQLRVGNIFITNIRSFADIRKSYEMGWTTRIKTFVVGASFLLVNVFLGLLGTFWFRTQRRKSEIALHKALGATNGNVFMRLFSEGILLLTLSTIVAIVADLNLAMAELNQYHNGTTLEADRFIICVVVSYVLMVGMILLGILFPARKAMRIQPAEALHEE